MLDGDVATRELGAGDHDDEGLEEGIHCRFVVVVGGSDAGGVGGAWGCCN